MDKLGCQGLNDALHNMGYYDGSNPVIYSRFKEVNSSGHAVYEAWLHEPGFEPSKGNLYVWERDGVLVADF